MNYKHQIKNSIDYIEKHLCEDIKLSEIAKQSHFSEFYFHRLFHRIVGKTVMEYIREKRLSGAAQELAETDEKITDIALKYQFSSSESFSRAFKKYYMLSPRKYRLSVRCSAGIMDSNSVIKNIRKISLSSTKFCRAA